MDRRGDGEKWGSSDVVKGLSTAPEYEAGQVVIRKGSREWRMYSVYSLLQGVYAVTQPVV
jgi:hypothetical protein